MIPKRVIGKSVACALSSFFLSFFEPQTRFFFSGPFLMASTRHSAGVYGSYVALLFLSLTSLADRCPRLLRCFVGKKRKRNGQSYSCSLLCSRLQYFGMQLHGYRGNLHTYWISDTVYICKRNTASCARFCAAATAQSCVCEYFLCFVHVSRICAPSYVHVCVCVCVYVTQFHPYTNITLHRAQARWPTENFAELSRDWICWRSKVHLRLVLAG